MDVILPSLKWKFTLVYLENVVVFSNTVIDRIKNLEAVLKFLRQSGVTLKLDKGFFFQIQSVIFDKL